MKKMNLTGASVEIMGIDLGTTNSAVSIYSAGTVPKLLPVGGMEKYTIQSCVRWDGFENGKPKFTVGPEAYAQRYLSNVIYSVKRIMGSDEAVTFVWPDDGCGSNVVMDGVGPGTELVMSPAEVSGEILKAIKNRVAELYKPLTNCVITVPAYFNQRQIEDTLKAAEYAGLVCRQILKEPTSASYIYSQLGYAQSGSVLIYDLGGGTFDVTHMHFLRKDSIPSKLFTSLKRQYGIDPSASGADVNDQYFCRVLGTYGDVHLGGDDIDRYCGDLAIKTYNLNLTDAGREQLYLRCEGFKKSGVFAESFVIEDQEIELTEGMLAEAVDFVFAKTLRIMEDIDVSDTNTIVLVGGSTKSQQIRDNLARVFPNMEISAVLDPDATVALGAGSVAKALANDTTMMYADVLPLPIGILVEETKVDVCIERNTSMPYSVQRRFFTLYDNQEQVTIHVYQGLSEKPEECTYLGRLTLKDIPAGEAGSVSVYVNFILDGQGRLRITSKINDVQREEELVIDNIFDATAVADAPKITSAQSTEEESSTITAQGLQPIDDFEKSFMQLLAGNEEADELFKQRRQAMKEGWDVADIQDIEDRIIQCMM